MVETALFLLSEIDAIGGEDYIYILPPLAQRVVFKRTIPSKSLAHLALPTSYFPEHKVIIQSFLFGQKISTVSLHI